MEQSVGEAARVLGVDESRIRVLLRSGDLAGRKIGGTWLVDGEDLARFLQHGSRSGRPFSPAHAWGVLDLLDGGDAPWLDSPGRSRARALARGLAGASAVRWRAALRRRQDRLACRAHPAAYQRLIALPGVLVAGPERAVAAGADLVAVDALPEVYVDRAAWPAMAQRLAIRQRVAGPNLVVHLPIDVDPFGAPGRDQPGRAVLAADLLDSVEPRSVNAGVALLNDLAGQMPLSRSGR